MNQNIYKILLTLSIISILPLCTGITFILLNDSKALFIGLLFSFSIHFVLFLRKTSIQHIIILLLFIHCLSIQGILFLCLFVIGINIDGYW